MRRFVLFFTLLMTPFALFAQYKTRTGETDIAAALRYPLGLGKSTLGLLGLDPSRLHIAQSYQMSYFTMGEQGVTQGMYLNTMSYQFKIPLLLTFQWGIAHQPGFGGPPSPFLQNGPFISGANLLYKPTDKMTIEIDFRQVPYGTYNSMWRRSRMGMW